MENKTTMNYEYKVDYIDAKVTDRDVDKGVAWSKITAQTENSDIRDFIQKVSATPVSPEEQYEMVRHLLSGLLPGRFQNDGTFTLSNQKDVAEANQVDEWLNYIYISKNHI